MHAPWFALARILSVEVPRITLQSPNVLPAECEGCCQLSYNRDVGNCFPTIPQLLFVAGYATNIPANFFDWGNTGVVQFKLSGRSFLCSWNSRRDMAVVRYKSEGHFPVYRYAPSEET